MYNLFYIYIYIFITQMNLSHLWLYNDHNNLISQDFHSTAQAPPPTLQTVSSRDHKFFQCLWISVCSAKKFSLSFFQIPHVSESIWCWCLIVWLTLLSMIISRSIHVAKNAVISFLSMAWVIFHCVYVPHLLDPLLCRCTFRLFPCLGYWKECCNEHWSTCVIASHVFLWIDAQEWDCWIKW